MYNSGPWISETITCDEGVRVLYSHLFNLKKKKDLHSNISFIILNNKGIRCRGILLYQCNVEIIRNYKRYFIYVMRRRIAFRINELCLKPVLVAGILMAYIIDAKISKIVREV